MASIAFKIMIYPTTKQKVLFAKTYGWFRIVYNYDSNYHWCEDNALNPLSAKSFSSYLIENADVYNLEPTNNIYIGGNKRARGFVGIELLQRINF